MPLTDTDGNNVECSKPFKPESTQCEKCEYTIILHCDTCRVQITGCNCTMKKRKDEDASPIWHP